MTARWRLDSKAPRIASEFRRASDEKKRRATVVACETAARCVGLDDNDDVIMGVQALREGRTNDSALRQRLTALSNRLDDDYFRHDEEGDDPNKAAALHLFAKARAASALAFALVDDASQLHEALYEAMSALIDDPERVTQAIEEALRGRAPN